MGAGGGEAERRTVKEDMTCKGVSGEVGERNEGEAGCEMRKAVAPVNGLEPATDRSLQISGRILYPLCHRRARSNRRD
ncbi:hypothetical protein PoB_003602000 [Plakobranchus ocellatus]|uniref:Uncharacterized protein n=1 Tax=Plakobranchus ocellatus TaxID=259542 RepID=A0AAV4AQA2_9GAST|nr:hypothetical protein PoB_003602000 [Plakobranchus ocellatus]